MTRGSAISASLQVGLANFVLPMAKVFGANSWEGEINSEATALPPTGWVKSVAGTQPEDISRNKCNASSSSGVLAVRLGRVSGRVYRSGHQAGCPHRCP